MSETDRATQEAVFENFRQGALKADSAQTLITSRNPQDIAALIGSFRSRNPYQTTVIFTEFLTQNIWSQTFAPEIIETLGIALQNQPGEAEQQPTTQDIQKQALHNFFSTLTNRIPEITKTPHGEDELISQTYSFLNRNRRLTQDAQPFIEKLLEKNIKGAEILRIVGDLYDCDRTIEIVSNYLNSESIWKPYTQEDTLKLVGNKLHEAPGELTEETKNLVARVLKRTQEQLPSLTQSTSSKKSLLDGLTYLLQSKPEISSLAENVIVELITSSPMLSPEITALVSNYLPFDNALMVVNRVVHSESTFVTWHSINMLNAINTQLESRDINRPGILTEKEVDQLKEIATGLIRHIPRIIEQPANAKFFNDELQQLSKNSEVAPLVQDLKQKFNAVASEIIQAYVARYLPHVRPEEVAQIIAEDRISETLESLKRFDSLYKIASSLRPDQQQQFLRTMNDRLQEQNAEPFMNLLETIFEIHESSGLRGALEIRGIGQFSLIDNLNYLLNDESIYVLLDTLLDNPDSYRFQIGLILSQVNLTNLPDKVKAKIKPTLTDTEMQLLPEHGRWWLCGAAEPRLVQSLQDNAILLINNF
jgi:hypothetical protein